MNYMETVSLKSNTRKTLTGIDNNTDSLELFLEILGILFFIFSKVKPQQLLMTCITHDGKSKNIWYSAPSSPAITAKDTESFLTWLLHVTSNSAGY